MPVINGVYLKDFTALPGAVADANIIPIAISGDNIAYRTTVAGIITDARITSKLLTGLSVTGGAVVSTDTILEAFGKVQNQLNGKQGTITLGAIGAVPNANAATITGTVLNLEPASASFGGVVTTGTQTFAGAKTFSNDVTVNSLTIGRGGGLAIENTTVGYQALSANNTTYVTAGIYNTAFGSQALSSNSATATLEAFGNSAFGYQSLKSNTIGVNNTAVGRVSLTANTTGQQNTALGTSSLTTNSSGSFNTAIGNAALWNLTTGSYNTAIGRESGSGITTGSGNTIIGSNVSSLDAGLTNNIILAIGTGSIKAQYDGTNWTFTGGATITGQLSLGSTITNGTYTYTLPGATGTIALTSDLSGYVTLATSQTITADKTFTTSGNTDTLTINHSSGSGIALSITKGGNGEGIYVNKTSGSGNAATIIGTLNATTLVKSGGTSSQFLMADGSVNTSVLPTGAYLPLTGGTLTGALSGTSASFSATSQFLDNTGASTTTKFIRISNTSGDMAIGVDGSTPTQIASGNGGIAYSTVLKTVGATALILGTNSIAALTINGSTQAATFSNTLGINGVANSVTSGTYTPTLTNVENIEAATASNAIWSRVGNTVTVYTQVGINPTTISLETQVALSIPVASNFTNSTQCFGNAITAASTDRGVIYSDNINDRVVVYLIPTQSAANQTYHISFSYQVL